MEDLAIVTKSNQYLVLIVVLSLCALGLCVCYALTLAWKQRATAQQTESHAARARRASIIA